MPEASLTLEASGVNLCVHCGNTVPRNLPVGISTDFCCNGCQTVYGLLKKAGLTRYYKMRQETAPKGTSLRRSSETVPASKYQHLNEPQFANCATMNFYVEGVHCSACVWLFEKLPQLIPGVTDSRLDFGRSMVRIAKAPEASFAEIASKVAALGYTPHPIEKNEQLETMQVLENRRWLIRIGVAAAVSMNIMLFAVPLYAGADGWIAQLFRVLSAITFLPVFFYSAVPFYRSSWNSIKTRSFSIDIPIVFALALGAGMSFWNLRTTDGHLYFDSLAALVFLLLSTRYFLRRLQQKALDPSRLFHILQPKNALRILDSGQTEAVDSGALNLNDRVRVERNESVPADGALLSTSARLNNALITGEALPQSLHRGDMVFAGTVNLGDPFELSVTASGRNTRLGKITQAVDLGIHGRSKTVIAADKIAKAFLAAVVLTALIALFGAPSWEEGMNRALALLIVTCPCALALASPLVMSFALETAAKCGALVKDSATLEKLTQAKNIVFDKTGTLTHGDYRVLTWEPAPNAEVAQAVLALEKWSRHPVARALIRHIESLGYTKENIVDPSEFEEVLGRGVRGVVHGRHYEIRSISDHTGIFSGDTLVATIRLGDEVRPESKSAIATLRSQGYGLRLFSGDHTNNVATVAKAVGLTPDEVVAEASPELKQNLISELPNAIMVGDGANDAPALAHAFVGIAVHGSMEVSLRSGEVFFSKQGLNPLLDLLTIAFEARKVLYFNFAVSIAYNVAGATAALMGWVTPLFAALLMPTSALTVYLIAVFGTKKLRELKA